MPEGLGTIRQSFRMPVSPVASVLAAFLAAGAAFAQNTGVLRGRVRLDGGDPIPDVRVQVLPLNRSAATDAQGQYEFKNLPAGSYEVVAHQHPFRDRRGRVDIKPGAVVTLDLDLQLAPVHEHITVTASGREQTAADAFQTVTSVESMELTARSAPSLGEVLENVPGVAKRSSGPGTTRPVIRGFDGDRVLILEDGMPTGTLSYQSGDHGEPVDASTLERVEVVRGPATLLYGSNAIGGVVNAISSQQQVHQHPHEGWQGHMNTFGGSGNGMAGGNAAFDYGFGNWMIRGGGGAQRTGDYQTPIGEIRNSHTRMEQSRAGFGYFDEKYFGNLTYGISDGTYGVPDTGDPETAEHVDLKFRRHTARFDGGLNNLAPPFERLNVNLNYTDWRHFEVSEGHVHNRFYNRQFNYRGVLDQRKTGPMIGSFGVMGNHRDYEAIGEEAFAPPVTQNAFAAFVLEEFDLRRFRLQFGGRVENVRFRPASLDSRSFTGFSGAAGFQAPLWPGGVFVANYTHSFRAPALEELYAEGPHAGNLTFEIGDVNLARERADGLDVSVRQHSQRIRSDFNLFQYWITGYIFLAPTGNIREDLIEARYSQGDARYRGAEWNFDVALIPNIWLNLGMDFVRADLSRNDTPLPRIPPLRGHAGLDARFKGVALRPGLVIAGSQSRIFPTETPTAGYGVFNFDASYVITRQHTMHIFGAECFNLSNRLYRNHLSFIKEFAPEIGRGVRFRYTLEFF